MNLGELFNYVNFISNKEVSGKTFSPAQFNLNLKAVNIELMKLKLGLPEEYRKGVTLPSQAWEISQKITEDLKNFKVWLGEKGTMPLVINANGVAQLPSNYVYPSSIRYKKNRNISCGNIETKFRKVEILFDSQLGDRLQNSIKSPSKKYPVCVIYSDFIQFYPKDLQFVDFTYIRKPTDPVYAYNIVNDVPVYDPINSVELEWDEQLHVDIARMLLAKIGINLKDTQLFQYAEIGKQKGI